MKLSGTSNSLRWNLTAVIALKILFLCIFWQLILKHEVTHVTADSMTERLLFPISVQ